MHISLNFTFTTGNGTWSYKEKNKNVRKNSQTRSIYSRGSATPILRSRKLLEAFSPATSLVDKLQTKIWTKLLLRSATSRYDNLSKSCRIININTRKSFWKIPILVFEPVFKCHFVKYRTGCKCQLGQVTFFNLLDHISISILKL